MSLQVSMQLLFCFLVFCFFFTRANESSRRYPAKTITEAEYAEDVALLANTPTQAEFLQHSLERIASGIGIHVNTDKTEYICFNQRYDISTLNGGSLKLVDKFTYLRSSVSSIENDINTWLAKVGKTNDRLSVIWKSDLSNELKLPSSDCVSTTIWIHHVDAD